MKSRTVSDKPKPQGSERRPRGSGRRPANLEQAAWILYRMKLAGLTQCVLADQIGVTDTMIRWVIYDRTASFRVRKGVAEALGFASWDALLVAFKRRKRVAA